MFENILELGVLLVGILCFFVLRFFFLGSCAYHLIDAIREKDEEKAGDHKAKFLLWLFAVMVVETLLNSIGV